MKALVAGSLALAVAATASVSQAADERDWYVGAKLGWMSSSDSDFDESMNLGLVAGLHLPGIELPFEANVAVEGEYSTSISDGDWEEGSLEGEWDIDTFAVYGVVRTDGDIYFKGKGGIIYEDISVSGDVSDSASSTDLSFGLGAGWKLNDKLSLEAEFTLIEEDVSFFSIGVLY